MRLIDLMAIEDPREIILFMSFFKVYYLFERDRDSTSAGEAERETEWERERESHARSTLPAQSRTRGSNSGNYKIKS